MHDILSIQVPENTGKPLELHTIKSEKFNHGGEKNKYKITAEIDVNGTPQQLKLVLRPATDNTENFYNIWEYCHKLDGPVIPLMGKTENGDLISPDLEADGSTLYGKGINAHMSGGHGELRRYEARDNIFLEIFSKAEEVEIIRDRAQKAADWFTQHGVFMATDDPFELIVHPDGTYDIFELDLEHAQRNPETLSDSEMDTMKSENDKGVREFMYELQKANTKLLQLREKPNLKTISQSKE